MNIKITLILSFILLLFTSAQAEQKKVKISGSIAGLEGREVVLLNYDRSEIVRTKGNGNAFEITGTVEAGDGRFYQLYVPALGDLGPSMKIPTLHLFIDAEEIVVEAKIEDGNLRTVAIKGSPDMEEYQRLEAENPYNAIFSDVIKEYNNAFHQYNEVKKTDENMVALKAASAKIDSIEPKVYQHYVSLIPQYRKSNALVVYTYNYYASATPEKQQEMIDAFDKSMENNFFINRLIDHVSRVKACAVGQQAPEAELKNLKGETVKLSSLKGKYTLIDFWASWCGPCRKEIPNLKKLYAEYKDKGLQIVGISIDDSDEKWQKAVKEEQLDYLQLHDKSKITMKQYDYQGIPFIILLSPDGIILEKGLRGEKIKETLQKYIK